MYKLTTFDIGCILVGTAVGLGVAYAHTAIEEKNAAQTLARRDAALDTLREMRSNAQGGKK